MSALPPILKLHNRYRQTGGEEAVVAAEYAMLRSAGHEVTLREVTNDEISGLGGQARAFAGAAGNQASAQWLDRQLDQTGARIVHVHNFFPLLSPAIHCAAANRGVAVVQTLHNFRLLCAAATFLREGAVCEKCVNGGRQWALVHRCYRNSLPGSLASVMMQRATIGDPEWIGSVHRFIALSDFARDKMIAGGLPAARVAVKGNFLAEPRSVAAPPLPDNAKRSGAIYVGRLSKEKGVTQMVDAWRNMPDIPLTVVGTGPLETMLKERAPGHVRFVGHCSDEEVSRWMAQAAVLVMPSLWYEGFPRTMVEAFARHLPVVASDIGSLSEIAQNAVTARLFKAGDGEALENAVRDLIADRPQRDALAARAYSAYRARHTAEVNLALLETVYTDALAEVSSQ